MDSVAVMDSMRPDMPPPPPPPHGKGRPPHKPDNMRGFDPASEDDMDDKAASARITASANCLITKPKTNAIWKRKFTLTNLCVNLKSDAKVRRGNEQNCLRGAYA